MPYENTEFEFNVGSISPIKVSNPLYYTKTPDENYLQPIKRNLCISENQSQLIHEMNNSENELTETIVEKNAKHTEDTEESLVTSLMIILPDIKRMNLIRKYV